MLLRPNPKSVKSVASTIHHFAESCKSMREVKQLHAYMITTSLLHHDPFSLSRLLSFSALSPSGDLSYALSLFSSLPRPTSFMFNTLIWAHASSPTPLTSLTLFIQMRRKGVLPGKHTFTFLLKACSRLKFVVCCQQVHASVLKFGFGLDLHVVNGLVRGYSVSGCLEDARKVFDGMCVRSLSVWTTMICGYAQNGNSEEAILLFDEMVELGVEPSGVTLA